ncbi:MAG: SDR family oxidoreductase [Planctomycetota bacterium]|nr:SDR family oxidoreductase [Planctomycetota bacterium]
MPDEKQSQESRPLNSGGPLSGRVGVVTGAGSGLGRGISLFMIEAGATVVGLDVDREALDATSAEQPAGSYLPVFCDVTDEKSVEEAFESAVSSTEGIDYLVNAAGIAPAYPLEDFPLGAWQKTLDINLTGYFLCAREAVRIMKKQGSGGSIINITSKSGLEASKSNSAYNATKAGEIHLMRGWAMELGGDGIRVNCVAPGNVFKGSKIWNEEYIEACAKKKGIKPGEVIDHYTAQSPLGKEIEPEDVASAVVYLLSDAARRITGQVLVVDGGQVMVR